MKKLNKYQRTILLVAILLFLSITFFPPWRALTNPPDYDIGQAIGYAPLFDPPNSPLGYESYVVLNYGRLFLEWLGLALLAGAGILLTRKK